MVRVYCCYDSTCIVCEVDYMKAYCDKCNKEQEYSITTKKTRLLKYMFKIARCNVCNEKIYIDEIIEENLKEFDDCMDNVEAINKKAAGRK